MSDDTKKVKESKKVEGKAEKKSASIGDQAENKEEPKKVETTSESNEKTEEKPAEETVKKEKKVEETPEEKETKPTSEVEKTTDEASVEKTGETISTEVKKEEVAVEVKKEEVATEEKSAEEKNEGQKEELKEKEVEEAGKKKPKRFQLPFLSKKKKQDKEEVEEMNEEISADEAIDKVDPENRLKTVATIKKLADEIDEQIAEATDDDYLTLRVKKKKVVIGLGLLVILMWVLVMAKEIPSLLGIELFNRNQDVTEQEQPPQEEAQNEEVTEDTQASESAVLKIRIKVLGENQDVAEEIASMLKDNGFDQIELIDDTESVYDNLVISTKLDDSDTKAKLTEMLGEKYNLNTEYTDLTLSSDDEDLDAVLIVGTGSKK